jgi:hypothetical protein
MTFEEEDTTKADRSSMDIVQVPATCWLGEAEMLLMWWSHRGGAARARSWSSSIPLGRPRNGELASVFREPWVEVLCSPRINRLP